MLPWQSVGKEYFKPRMNLPPILSIYNENDFILWSFHTLLIDLPADTYYALSDL